MIRIIEKSEPNKIAEKVLKEVANETSSWCSKILGLNIEEFFELNESIKNLK